MNDRPTKLVRRLSFWLALAILAVSGSTVAAGCSPIYVIRAGWAEARILRARRPIVDVILDPATDQRTRGKLTLARQARTFAEAELLLDVGDSYTTYTQLDRDTLAMVLSAAERDRLAAKTWWFPVVGRVPYRGFFNLDAALEEQRSLEDDGFDTYLRPTSAFSTLGWFSDPVLSTVLRQDEVGVVETIIHEVSHSHLFVQGNVRFNESFATFVGSVGAIKFFCGEPDDLETVRCRRAKLRWQDAMIFSVFLDGVIDDLERVYGDTTLSIDDRLSSRQRIFDEAVDRFVADVQPTLGATTYQGFVTTPLNNATLLSRMRYYHRLPDFQAFLEQHGGDLAAAVAAIAGGVGDVQDPFDLLPGGDARTDTDADAGAEDGTP